MGDELTLDERVIARLERRVQDLERALRPFAELGFAAPPNTETVPALTSDCRRAARVLEGVSRA